MKTIEELKKYFETDLKPDVETLEAARKKVASKVMVLNIFCIIGIVIGVVLFFIIRYWALIVLIPAVLLWIILYGIFVKNYKSDFKTKIIGRIIKFMDNNLEYSPAQCISMGEYMNSGIFTRHPDRYNGDDLVYGKFGNTNLKFSELHSEYKTTTHTKNGTRTTYHTIFKGIFFIAEFNKKFKSVTFVLPDVAQKMFGNLIGNMFQNMNKMRGQLVKMEDVDFEKQFVVYSTDQVDARFVLSTSLMRRITDYQKGTGKNIYLSFVNNNVNVAISYFKNLFEPKLFKTLNDFSMIREYYDDLSLALKIVEELNLNTRIWG